MKELYVVDEFLGEKIIYLTNSLVNEGKKINSLLNRQYIPKTPRDSARVIT
jgi:hypothetical protein